MRTIQSLPPAMTVADIEAADRPALLALWQQSSGKPPPRKISMAYLRRFLAFDLQARRRGGVPKGFLRDLERAAGEDRKAKAKSGLAPGARLMREWNGTTHVVDVTEDGLHWRGEAWPSLSAIAREITGAHWSGPRFFGLTGKGG